MAELICEAPFKFPWINVHQLTGSFDYLCVAERDNFAYESKFSVQCFVTSLQFLGVMITDCGVSLHDECLSSPSSHLGLRLSKHSLLCFCPPGIGPVAVYLR